MRATLSCRAQDRSGLMCASLFYWSWVAQPPSATNSCWCRLVVRQTSLLTVQRFVINGLEIARSDVCPYGLNPVAIVNSYEFKTSTHTSNDNTNVLSRSWILYSATVEFESVLSRHLFYVSEVHNVTSISRAGAPETSGRLLALRRAVGPKGA